MLMCPLFPVPFHLPPHGCRLIVALPLVLLETVPTVRPHPSGTRLCRPAWWAWADPTLSWAKHAPSPHGHRDDPWSLLHRGASCGQKVVRASSSDCWVSLVTESWARLCYLAKHGGHSQKMPALAFHPLDPSAPPSWLPGPTLTHRQCLSPFQSAGLRHFPDPGLGFCGVPIIIHKNRRFALPLPALAAALWPD